MAFVTFSNKKASYIPLTNINLGPGSYNHQNQENSRRKQRNVDKPGFQSSSNRFTDEDFIVEDKHYLMMKNSTPQGDLTGKLENNVIDKILKGTNQGSAFASRTDRFDNKKKDPKKRQPDPGVYYNDPMEQKISDIKTTKIIKDLYNFSKSKSGFLKTMHNTNTHRTMLSENKSNEFKTTRDSFFKSKSPWRNTGDSSKFRQLLKTTEEEPSKQKTNEVDSFLAASEKPSSEKDSTERRESKQKKEKKNKTAVHFYIPNEVIQIDENDD